jgi:hypothetical protein
MIRIIVIPSECCPVIDGIARSNLVLMKRILNDPKSGTVTFWNNKLGPLIIKIGQVGDVIIWHAEDISDFNDTCLVKHRDQHMISWELEDIVKNMG